jgi:hypothetical protein
VTIVKDEERVCLEILANGELQMGLWWLFETVSICYFVTLILTVIESAWRQQPRKQPRAGPIL